MKAAETKATRSLVCTPRGHNSTFLLLNSLCRGAAAGAPGSPAESAAPPALPAPSVTCFCSCCPQVFQSAWRRPGCQVSRGQSRGVGSRAQEPSPGNPEAAPAAGPGSDRCAAGRRRRPDEPERARVGARGRRPPRFLLWPRSRRLPPAPASDPAAPRTPPASGSPLRRGPGVGERLRL